MNITTLNNLFETHCLTDAEVLNFKKQIFDLHIIYDVTDDWWYVSNAVTKEKLLRLSGGGREIEQMRRLFVRFLDYITTDHWNK